MELLLDGLFEGDESSFYARMARQGSALIRDEDFADCYSATMGRPSIPPSLLMLAVLLQLRDDVSDREAARRAAKDLDWKRALGIDADVVPFHATSLSVFRSRLLINDADERVLKEGLLNQDKYIQNTPRSGLDQPRRRGCNGAAVASFAAGGRRSKNRTREARDR